MNRKTEVKVKFFDFLIMPQLSFSVQAAGMQQADHRSFSLHFVLCCGILNCRKFPLLRAAMVLRYVSSNRCVAVCIYIFYCVEVVYGFHSVLGFFHFLPRRTRLPPRCLRREQKNHERATKSSPFRGIRTIQGRQEHRENASVVLFI